MDNGLKAYYLEIYKEFERAEAQAKKLVKTALPLDKKIKSLIEEIRQARKQLYEIFSHPVLHQICNKCHQQLNQGCCQNKTDCPYMFWRDLVYLAAENLKFELPYPDIKFLTSLKKPGCIFLSLRGCLLKKKRSIMCLEHVCFDLSLGIKRLIGDGVLKERQALNLAASLNEKTRLLFAHIVNKNNLYSFRRDLSIIDYSLLRIVHPL